MTASSFPPLGKRALHIAATANLTPTPVSSAVVSSPAGSTDWITLMGVVIVLIVVIPVLFRRSTWMK
ncbi:MAG TPA: hypothetical protein VLX61_07375 [Anaerolineales bacterium]|nr:hypothetical protein [Anaerolineales bacterium]